MNITITKVKTLSGGLKGIEVKYRRHDEVNNRNFNNGHTEECKHPIHADLEKAFKDLRFFLLEITKVLTPGMEQDQVEEVLADCTVESINIGDGTFKLKGELMVTTSCKYISLETPEMEIEDDYHNYQVVMSVIDTIKEETLLHMEGKKKVSDRDYMLRWVKANDVKGVTEETIAGMDENELKEFCTKILEKQGSLVMHQTDMSEEEVESADIIDLGELNKQPLKLNAK